MKQRHRPRILSLALSAMLVASFVAAPSAQAAPGKLRQGLRARRAFNKEQRADLHALSQDARALRSSTPHLDTTKARKEVKSWVRGRKLVDGLAVLLSAAREKPEIVKNLSDASRAYLRGYLRLRKELSSNEHGFEQVWQGELERTAAVQDKRIATAHETHNKVRSSQTQHRLANEVKRGKDRKRQVAKQKSAVLRAAEQLAAVEQDEHKLAASLGKGKTKLPPRRTSNAAKALAVAQVALSAQTLFQLSQTLEGAGQGTAALACFVLGYMIADPTSAFTTHFPLDSYFFPNTKIFDSVAKKVGNASLWDSAPMKALKKRLVRLAYAFQYHHDHPAALNQQATAQVAAPVAPASVLMQGVAAALPAELAPLKALLTGLSNGLYIAQPSHVYSHKPSRENNAAIQLLQKIKVFISSRAHGKHHHVPYPGNYAIVNGWSNKRLDRSKVFRKLEAVIYRKLGIIPNAWKEKGGAVIMREALGEAGPHPKLPAEAYQDVKIY